MVRLLNNSNNQVLNKFKTAHNKRGMFLDSLIDQIWANFIWDLI